MKEAEPSWKHYLTDYNEGLGLVYERFVLNDFLLILQETYGIQTVLEAPLYGMAGVSGINSVALAQSGCEVTLVDDNLEREEAASCPVDANPLDAASPSTLRGPSSSGPGAPDSAMQLARQAVAIMEQIPDVDTEREQAFEFVRMWIDYHQA